MASIAFGNIADVDAFGLSPSQIAAELRRPNAFLFFRWSYPNGTVNLVNNVRNELSNRARHALCGDFSPDPKRLGPGISILVSWEVIAAKVEEVVDPIMGGQETLCLPS